MTGRIDAAGTRALLDAAPDGIVVVDATGTILLVNAQAARMFGYDRDELLGKNVEILVPEAARQVHPAHRERYTAAPVARPMGAGLQLAARRNDGSEFAADISLSSVETGSGLLVVAACRDVTDRLAADEERERLRMQAERSRLEAQMQSSQRMESLGQLAGGVAHDFNNLLAVISNFATFALEEIKRVEEHEPALAGVRTDIEQIRLAAQRATSLTHQLLMFGRREVVRPRVISINEVVREMEVMLRRAIGEHIELVSYLDPDLHPTVIDRGQLEQVLVNLAVNARDAMPGGGKLTIDTVNVWLDGSHPAIDAGLASGAYVRLRVSDSGTGMPAEVRQRAFEPFFTTKPRGDGSGLGLATVYGIVTQAGGWVWLYSDIGVGTVITALLPATTAGQPSVTEDEPAVHASGSERVLLVEDEAPLREITGRILRRHGYEVSEAVDANEALAELSGGVVFDLLLTDVVMPGMLGKELVERACAVQPDIAVLFMSGYAQALLSEQGRLDAGVALVEKPFTEAELVRAVRAQLDTHVRNVQ